PLFLSTRCTSRYLPSFPTRRSSDLGVEKRVFLVELGVDALDELLLQLLADRPAKRARQEISDQALGILLRIGGCRRQRVEQPVRSEEHTSELQSLRHLVCRLLLEKK